MSDISIVHARMEELESEVAEHQEALEVHLAEYKTKHHKYVMIPVSPTLETATIAELREALDNAVRQIDANAPEGMT